MLYILWGDEKLLRDRGNIKWVSMMLPEHVKLLRDWEKEDEFQKMPELDEQQFEEMNKVICESMALGSPISMLFFDNKQYKTIIGNIHYVDEQNQKIRVVSREGKAFQISFNSIINVDLNKT